MSAAVSLHQIQPTVQFKEKSRLFGPKPLESKHILGGKKQQQIIVFTFADSIFFLILVLVSYRQPN